MEKESRAKKSFLNARTNLLCYLVSLCVAFFTRGILLNYLGAEFIGLTGTYASLLGFLNLAELGVGGAIGYVLYKPIFDGDQHKINEIVSVFGYLYRCIGLFILGGGAILSVFLPFIFAETSFSWFTLYWGFYASMISSLLGYFINYRNAVLCADQRTYIVVGYFQMATTAKVILQMILAIYVQSFILYFSIEAVFGIVNSILLNWKINKTYPWLDTKVASGKALLKKYPEIGKYVKQLFFHKIGGFVQYQIIPLLIYSYVSLPLVALYGNYTLITSKVQSLLSGVLDSTGAGVGNLISEGNRDKIFEVYKELLLARILIAGFFALSIRYLSSSFIALWLGEEYILSPVIVWLISVHFFLNIVRGTTDEFKMGFGLFYDVWSPVAEASIFLAVALIGGYYWGLPGLLCGPLVSLIIIPFVWKPYFVFSKGMKASVYKHWEILVSGMIVVALAYILSCFVFERFWIAEHLVESWYNWLSGALLFSLIMGIASTTFMYLASRSFRRFISQLKLLRKRT